MLSQIKAVGLLLIIVCAACFVGNAQTTNATLSGVVEDAKGAVVPGCKITITNRATGLERTVVSNSDGTYTIPLLPPATYTVMAEATGFKRVQIPAIILNVNDQRALRIQLDVGSVTSEVTVRADGGDTVRTDPAVATTIDRTFVSNLPLNGRSFSSLVLLTPGVTVVNAAGGEFGQFSVNGQRSSTNYFTVDGVSANIDISYSSGGGNNLALAGGFPGQSVLGGTTNLVSEDALQEFKIQASSYTAESGRQPGGQIQIVTRSGSNKYHGSVFDYLRNEALDARNYFNPEPAPETALRQNQFGGTFSGPLPLPRFGEGGPVFTTGKDKTFLFFSYEGQRLRLPASGSSRVPSIRLRQAAALALQPVLNAFSIPNGPEIDTTTLCPKPPAAPNPACDTATNHLFSGFSTFNFSLSNPSNLDTTSIRIDHILSKKETLFGRYSEAPSNRLTLGATAYGTRISASTKTLTLGLNSILGRANNELRVNFSRETASQQQILTGFGGAVPFDPTLISSGYDVVAAATFAFGGGNVTARQGTFADNLQRQFNLVDNLTLVKGTHEIKFGADYRRLSPVLAPESQISLRFTTEANVRSGAINTLSLQTVQPAHPIFNNYSFYAQDAWKLSRRFTLDLGLRWELNPSPSEADGQLPPVVVGIAGFDVRNATLATTGMPFYKTFWTAFAPRLGAAYQLRQTPGKETTIRGGFGVYYDLGNGSAANGWPFKASSSVGVTAQCPRVFPVSHDCISLPGIVPITMPTSSAVFSTDPNLKLPYSLQWNLTFEQSLTSTQSISVAYVAAIARRLLTTQFLNLDRLDPITGAPVSRPNTGLGQISYTFNGPTSDYHSLQAQYRVRFLQRLQGLFNYTWSHAIDDVSTDLDFGTLERGNSDFDIRHNFSGALHYDLPAFALPVFGASLLRGWAADLVFHAQSGLPASVSCCNTIIRDDGSFFNARPDLVTGIPLYIKDPSVPGGRRVNPAAFVAPPSVPNNPGTPARQGTSGRNIIRGLPLRQIDASLGRTIGLGEVLKLKLKVDVFNIFNHPNFGGYNLFFPGPTFGIANTTLNNALGGINSLYQLGGPRSIQLSARFLL